MTRPLAGNPSLDELVRIARELGCVVEVRRGTGELKVTHPTWARTILANMRRKDSPRSLLVAVRHLTKEAA